MKYSLSYLGCNAEQLPLPGRYANDGVEAVLFSPSHLEKEPWEQNWKNLELASSLYGAGNVTFHFPMNECDFVSNAGIRQRLEEGYQRAGQLGLAGMVVHSNRIRDVPEWKKFNTTTEQKKVIDILFAIQQQGASPQTWLGLENMPLVGNYGYETDPLFVGSTDFQTLPAELGVVWDVCHALSSRQYLTSLGEGKTPASVIARELPMTDLDPSPLADRIVHWHFAGSTGLNNPDTGETCLEGVLPSESDLPTQLHENALTQIQQLDQPAKNRTINFEVQEPDYTQRTRGPKIIKWAQRHLMQL